MRVLRLLILFGAGLLVLSAGLLVWRWHAGQPGRQCLTSVGELARCLAAGDGQAALRVVAMPVAQATRSSSEQAEFLVSALRDEVSVEGLRVLRKTGEFGPLDRVFPVEGASWARQAGVDPAKCLAFKAARGDVHAELVFFLDGATCRVVRVNNVAQLANGERP